MKTNPLPIESLERFLGTPNTLSWRVVDLDGVNVSVPKDWSDNAALILYKKYMRKDGVPNHRKPAPIAVECDNAGGGVLPSWLWPQQPDYGNANLAFGPECTAHQVFHRIAGHWTYAAWIYGYIDKGLDAETFYNNCYMGLAKQIFAPNSPQWFNTGIWWAYGCTGSSIAHHPLPDGMTIEVGKNAYRWPQTSACFILGVEDNLVEENGIFDTMHKEAQIFKYGSGAGANFSKIREKGAPLSSAVSPPGHTRGSALDCPRHSACQWESERAHRSAWVAAHGQISPASFFPQSLTCLSKPGSFTSAGRETMLT